MSAAVAKLDDPTAQAAADAALSKLEERERMFVTEFLSCGNAREAAEAAGFQGDVARAARRLRGRATVREAIAKCLAAREAAASVSHEGACALLEAALRVRVSDLLIYSDDGAPIGLRDRATLSAAEELRIEKYESKTHKSAKGLRGGMVWVRVELTPALEILDRLARLRSWSSDSPSFQILLASIDRPPAVGSQHGASLALVHDLAQMLLQGEKLDHYLIAHASGDAATMAALLREGAAELTAAALAIPVEASRAE